MCLITLISLKLPACYCLLTDINSKACLASRATARINKAGVEVVRTETVRSLERLKASVDILVCNPPYVATETTETGQTDLQAAWAGGTDGMNVTREVIDSLDGLLTESGVAYIVLEQCNKPASVCQYVR